MSALRKSGAFGICAVALLALTISGPAYANNLVTNGSFEVNTGAGQVGYNTSVTGWSVAGGGGGSYTFLFAPGTADTTGANGVYGGLSLWGPNNGSANGLPAASPDGGYFIAQDGDFQQSAITQTINGLTAGSSYTVSFYWAGAQQYGFDGPNTEQWTVSLGAQTQSTAVYSNPTHGFSGWQSQSFTYTATSSSEVLSFLAVGTPLGVPPFSLLDGVTLNANSSVPEPESLTLMATGLMGVIGFARYRFSKRG